MIPKRLKKGDTIGVVSSSSPIKEKNKEEMENARKILESYGFHVKYGKNMLKDTLRIWSNT